MAFGRLKTRGPDKVRKPTQQTDVETRIGQEEKYKHTPFLVKLFTNIRLILADVDPFKTTLIMTSIVLLTFIAVTVILPFFKVIQDFTNKWYFLSLFTGLTIGAYIMEIQNKKVREVSCEVSIDGKTYIADNRKIDLFDGGEIIYLINSNGKPLYCKEENNLRRWGEQRNIFIPREVLEQFGTIMGRRAKSYPDCKMKTVWMREVDAGIMYIPKKLSEARLLKQVEALESNLSVMNELNEQFKENAKKIAMTHADFEGTILNDLIKKQSSLQEAYMGTGQKLRGMINEMMYPYNRGGYQPYNRYQPFNRFGVERGSPPWQSVTPPVTTNTSETPEEEQ